VAKLFVYLISHRNLVLAVAVLGAILSAKGLLHTDGYHDGPA
jgi:hypothetical protein